jgi:hypothetical protein
MKLNVKAFALTCALVWGFGIFVLAWWVIMLDGPSGAVPLLSLPYRGFTFTPAGSVIGFLWAFPDGFVLGALIAWLYNLLAGRGSAAS